MPAIGDAPPLRRCKGYLPKDFGFWEFGETALRGWVGFHAMLPNLNLSQRRVLKHLLIDCR